MPYSRALFGSLVLAVAVAAAACSGGSSSSTTPQPDGSAAATSATPRPSASPQAGSSAAASPAASAAPTSGASSAPTAAIATATPLDARFVLPAGFSGSTIASISGARGLVALPNGDLIVGTLGSGVWLIPNAESPGATATPRAIATLSESPAEGVAYYDGTLYVGTNTTIWAIPYAIGAASAGTPVAIARVRQGPVAPNSDGDVHRSTSLAVTPTTIYAGVGSSCNACVEVDPTRATVQQMNLNGSNMNTLATRARNVIAETIDPATGQLWVGGAGQDGLPYGHPYEYLDSPTLRGSSGIDYGWPQCEEDHVPYNALRVSPAPNCSGTVAPVIEFPAYATLIGDTFYPASQTGTYSFPASYHGGIFVAAHGSWHCCPSTPPRVFFVAMNGDAPVTPVNWSDPTVQSTSFLSGLGSTSSSSGYLARPSGVAVGASGSLFVTDDLNSTVYRIRPTGH